MRVAQAKAEQRRAAARAREQEEIAHIQENRAKVVAAEAQVPLAIAESFRTGKLGLLDYYELKNVQADTRMRMSIAGSGSPVAGVVRRGKTQREKTSSGRMGTSHTGGV